MGDPRLLAVLIARVGIAENRTAEFTQGLLERGAEIEERLGLAGEYFQSARYALARLHCALVRWCGLVPSSKCSSRRLPGVVTKARADRFSGC